MKILFVIDQFYSANNGMTISARRFVDGLRGRGHEVRVCSTGSADDTPYAVDDFHFRVPLFEHIVSSEGMTFAIPDDDVLRTAIEWSDVTHIMMPFPLGHAAAEIALEIGKPFTTAFHVQPENITSTVHLGKSAAVNDLIYRADSAYFYRLCRHIHCPSEFIAGELRKRGYDKYAKLHVISNGIDPAFGYMRAEKPEELRDRLIVTSVGRMSKEKRQDVILRAAAMSRFRDKITVMLSGQGPMTDKYKRLADKLGVDCRIDFRTQDELIRLLSYSDLYVHAADAEIEAMSCMEAFACGVVPVIANSRKSATPQFAIDGRSRFRAGDPESLKKHMDWWLARPDEREIMGIMYSEHAKKWSMDRSITKFEAMLREAMGEKH